MILSVQSWPCLRIAYVVQVYAVNVVIFDYLPAYLSDVWCCAAVVWIHICFVTHLLEYFRMSAP